MTATTLLNRKTIPSAGMSEIIFTTKLDQACCIVGSCIALTLYHSRLGKGALAHIVLPRSVDRTGPPGKFADTAIPHMVDMLAAEGANQAGLVAKLCGGASMFGIEGPIKIGLQNAEAVKKLLAELGIPIVGEDLAGPKGRRVVFDSQTGELTIEIVGQPATTL